MERRPVLFELRRTFDRIRRYDVTLTRGNFEAKPRCCGNALCWSACGNKVHQKDLSRMVQIDVLEKPIERIKETCEMAGLAAAFDRALPELETFLEAEVAKGETRETRLTYDGLCYLRRVLPRC